MVCGNTIVGTLSSSWVDYVLMRARSQKFWVVFMEFGRLIYIMNHLFSSFFYILNSQVKNSHKTFKISDEGNLAFLSLEFILIYWGKYHYYFQPNRIYLLNVNYIYLKMGYTKSGTAALMMSFNNTQSVYLHLVDYTVCLNTKSNYHRPWPNFIKLLSSKYCLNYFSAIKQQLIGVPVTTIILFCA